MTALERLIAAVPPFVGEDPVMAAIYAAIAHELDVALEQARTTPAQACPQLVSWGLARLEAIYDVIPAAGASDAQRRGVLLAKMRAAPVSTLERIRNVASSYGGDGVEIVEDASAYAVHLRVLNVLGNPDYMDELRRSLRAAVPAHLALVITLRWLTWNELRDRGETWAQIYASGVTWANLKEHGGV